MKNESKKTGYLYEISNDLENAESKLKPFYHTNFRESLEKVVFKEKPEIKSGLVEKIFSNKTQTLHSTIKALLDEIKLREELDIHLVNKINNDICMQHSQLSHLESLNVHYVFEWQEEVNNQKLKFENNILGLEQEKRKEYLECWRDLMILKKYLLSSLKDFWEFVKKRDLLSASHDNENISGDRRDM